jgi:hypothetical protein
MAEDGTTLVTTGAGTTGVPPPPPPQPDKWTNASSTNAFPFIIAPIFRQQKGTMLAHAVGNLNPAFMGQRA